MKTARNENGQPEKLRPADCTPSIAVLF
jgi:hypothetical protein